VIDGQYARPNGAQFDIIVDDRPRSYRDLKAVAIQAAIFLNEAVG
jgi:hypothetical protein